MPTLYIIAGPNGAGKTTFARQFLSGEAPALEFVNADSIAQGLAPYNPEEAAMAAGRLMLIRLRELSKQRVSFALETTLSGRAYHPMLVGMKEVGYEIEMHFLWLPHLEQSIDRVSERVTQGGHHIPEDVIRRRHAKGVKNLFQLYRPLLDRWSLYNNVRPPARLIAQETSGNLLVLDLEAFAKVEEVVQGDIQ